MKKRLAWFVVLIMMLTVFAVPVAAIETETCNIHTQGYWKNHEEAWTDGDCPAIRGIDTQEEWLVFLKTPPKGDPWFILAHQYIAAYLSGLQSTSMNDAATILTDYGPGQIPEGLVEEEALYLANLFDAYNNKEL